MTDEVDPRDMLASERTYLAWIRTTLALVVCGLVAAKAVDFDHELARWLVAAPPIVGGALLAVMLPGRFDRDQVAMREGRALPVRRALRTMAFAVAGYAALVLAAVALD